MKNQFIIEKRNFNLKQIADSGQCFRMNQIEEDKYSITAYRRYLELRQLSEGQIEFSCSKEEYEEIWEDYFDLTYDYESIVQCLTHGADLFLREAAEFGKGIRILKQEPFEMMISYIISQNKNIPAIKSCIEAICTRYGEKKQDPVTNAIYYCFPTPEVLANARKEELRQLKTGYRDEYIIKAAQAVTMGDIDLRALRNCDYADTFNKLKTIHGIGDKVANCICLYGFHHIGVFPVDVWIARILKEIYQDQFNPRRYEGYAGIVQQYMFYYIRNGKK